MAGQMAFPFAQPPPGRLSRSGWEGRGAYFPAAACLPGGRPGAGPRHHPIDIDLPPGPPAHLRARGGAPGAHPAAGAGPPAAGAPLGDRQLPADDLLLPPGDGILQARVHHMFLDAPARRSGGAGPLRGDRSDRAASLVVGQYIDENGHRIRASRPVSTPLSTQGRTHDLLILFQS